MLYIWLILGSILWGSNVICMRFMLEHTSSTFLACLKVFLSLIAIFFIIKFKHQKIHYYPFKLTLIVSLFAITLNFVLTFNGLNLISGSSNAIINALAPMITIVLAKIIYHQKINRYHLMALFLSLLAFLISIDFNLSNLSSGHFLMIMGVVLYCMANLIMQHHLENHDNLSFTFNYQFYGLLQLLIIFLIDPGYNELEKITPLLFMIFILLSGFGFALIQIIYFNALIVIGSIKASFILGLNPFFTYLGSLLFQEQFQWNRFNALMLLIIAMVIVCLQKQEN